MKTSLRKRTISPPNSSAYRSRACKVLSRKKECAMAGSSENGLSRTKGTLVHTPEVTSSPDNLAYSAKGLRP